MSPTDAVTTWKPTLTAIVAVLPDLRKRYRMSWSSVRKHERRTCRMRERVCGGYAT